MKTISLIIMAVLLVVVVGNASAQEVYHEYENYVPQHQPKHWVFKNPQAQYNPQAIYHDQQLPKSTDDYQQSLTDSKPIIINIFNGQEHRRLRYLQQQPVEHQQPSPEVHYLPPPTPVQRKQYLPQVEHNEPPIPNESMTTEEQQYNPPPKPQVPSGYHLVPNRPAPVIKQDGPEDLSNAIVVEDPKHPFTNGDKAYLRSIGVLPKESKVRKQPIRVYRDNPNIADNTDGGY